MTIEYLDSLDHVTADDLGGFFAGWPNPPSPATHLRLLRGSRHVILAREQGARQIVGFITALTDGVLCAYIPLLEVLPAYRGRGIGTALMERMKGRLRDYYAVDLLCDPEVQPFYRRLGMQPLHGMGLRNYGRQAGREDKEG